MPEDTLNPDRDTAPSFEDLLVELLAAVEVGGASAGTEICLAHPEHAPRLRSHLQRLSQLGLLPLATEQHKVDGFPERLGDYRLLKRIGGGGMGMVFLAEQVSLARHVALKLIRPEQLYFAGARERFAREAKAVASLEHPGIVPVHGAGEDGGVPWLAMEKVDGVSLEQVLATIAGRPLPGLTGADLAAAVPGADLRSPIFAGTWVAACLQITRAVAEALHHAHQRGVLHRDVKPSNIMLTANGRVLLLDFGLALSEGTARLTHTQGQLGSPAYMSPEQVRGQRELDGRTDVYSLGVTMFELLTRRAPYLDESVDATRTLVLAGRPPQMRRQNPSIPGDAELVCLKAMDCDVARRYPSAAAFAEDLGNLLELRPIQARPPTATLVMRRWVQRHPAIATGLVAAVLLLIVTPTAFWLQQRAANATIRRTLADAQLQRDRAREAVQFMLTRVAGEELLDVPRMQRLRRDLFEKAHSFHERFLRENGSDPAMLEQATDSALQVAMLDAELGRSGDARESATRARDLARSLVAREGSNPKYLALLAKAEAALAATLQQTGKLDLALAEVRAAMATRQQLLRIDPADAETTDELLALRRNEAILLSQLGQLDEAASAYREILQRAPGLIAVAPDGLVRPTTLDQALGGCSDAAYFFRKYGKNAEALQAIACAEAVRGGAADTSLTSTGHFALARVVTARARILAGSGDAVGAEAAFRQALADLELVFEHTPEHANALRWKASVCNDLSLLVGHDRDRAGDARDLMNAAVATMRQLVAIDPSVTEQRANLAASLLNQAGQLREQARLQEAEGLFREAIELAEGALRETPTRKEWEPIVYNATWFLGLVRGQLGDHRGEVAAADQLTSLRREDATTLRIAAGLTANAALHIDADTGLTAAERSAARSGCVQRAIELLRRSAELGCTEIDLVRTAAEFAAIRSEPGFVAARNRIEANAAHK
jgi:serine/threonine protein kinase/tetratricopeptide (TPR) repeat protein